MTSKTPDEFFTGAEKRVLLFIWLLTAASVAVVVFIKLRLLQLPLERDEGEYAYAAQLILNGDLPYRDLYNMKFPGVYYVYSLFIFVFGHSIIAIRLGGLLVVVITAFVLARLVELVRNRSTGLMAASAFLIFSIAPAFEGLMTNAEHFVNLFVVTAIYFFCRWLKEKGNLNLFASGLMCGLACAMKQHGALFMFIPLTAIVLTHLFTSRDLRTTLRSLLILFAGFISVLILMCVVIYVTGTWDNFFRLTLQYSRHYISYRTWSQAYPNFIYQVKMLAFHAWPMWLFSFIGLLFSYKLLSRTAFWMLLLWCVIGVIVVLPGYYFRNHYFLMTIPPAAICFALFFDLIVIYFRQFDRRLVYSVAFVLYSCSVGYFLIDERQTLFKLSPTDASTKMYLGNVFNDALVVADYVRNNSTPDDKIFIIGSEPQIYFYAERKAASGFIYLYPLLETHPMRQQMLSQYVNEALSNNPKIIVNSRNSSYDEKLQDSIITVLNQAGKYKLDGYGYQDWNGVNHFVWSDSTYPVPEERVLWEFYKRERN